MLHTFLEANRRELIERCKAKVARRDTLAPAGPGASDGIPLFLGQLIAALRAAPLSTAEFKTLPLCLDDAIAGAVTEYDRQRNTAATARNARDLGERLGFLAHELRNFLNTAVLAFAAVRSGSVGIDGATSNVIDRSLGGMGDLIDRALSDARLAAGPSGRVDAIDLEQLVTEAGASLAATLAGCQLEVCAVAPGITLLADRQLVAGAIDNLLQNAFKLTPPGTRVLLRASATDDRVLIEALRAADLPGTGCVFTIDLPRGGIGSPAHR
jgi:signal transduction histidine kinase